jgi:tetratricopeptide (TPR) repeat protein
MSVLALALLLQASFESPQAAFQRAEGLYQEQRYEEAVEAYEAMRAQGVEDGTLYYNLGNAYFKAGELGRAILNYERALRLLPGDPDAKANLAYANELRADEVASPPLPAVLGWLVDAYRRLSPSLLAGLLSFAFLAAGGAVSLLLLETSPALRDAAIYGLVAFAILALASGAALTVKVTSAAGQVEAIVLSDNAYVRSGPGASSPRLAEVHEGLKVRVLGEREGWLQVGLDNGLTGWLESDALERI